MSESGGGQNEAVNDQQTFTPNNLHQSAHSSCGQGGQLKQMQQLEKVMDYLPKKWGGSGTNTGVHIPENTPENAMAPLIHSHHVTSKKKMSAPQPIAHTAEPGSHFGFCPPLELSALQGTEETVVASPGLGNDKGLWVPKGHGSVSHTCMKQHTQQNIGAGQCKDQLSNEDYTNPKGALLPAPLFLLAHHKPMVLDPQLEVYSSIDNVYLWQGIGTEDADEREYDEEEHVVAGNFNINFHDGGTDNIQSSMEDNVDELSPDEDGDKLKHTFTLTKNDPESADDSNDPVDVLDAHQKKDHPYAPPNPLSFISNSQSVDTEPAPATNNNAGNESDDGSDADLESSEPTQKT
ncbi:hypothetical protein BDQ17DRAFT_1429174 [Cyathus striatus]|nr:hypothetical protein BDQ17DRAFT_1429174 [Cyathus striatus]